MKMTLWTSKLPKVITECSSNRRLLPGHIDGYEHRPFIHVDVAV